MIIVTLFIYGQLGPYCQRQLVLCNLKLFLEFSAVKNYTFTKLWRKFSTFRSVTVT